MSGMGKEAGDIKCQSKDIFPSYFSKNLLLGGIYFIKMLYDVLTSVERHVVMEGVAVYLQIDGPH